MKEVIVVANLQGGSNTAPAHVPVWLRGLEFTVALISELGSLKPQLEKVGKVYSARRDNPTDVGVVVASRVQARAHKAISAIYRQLTKFIRRPGTDTPRLWRDRWVVRVRIFNRVYYSVHANALIANFDGEWLNNKGADAWKDALRELADMIRSDTNKKLRVRIGGDFNMFVGDHELAPNRWFNSLGLDWTSDNRVMYFAWDKKTTTALVERELPTAPGTDAHGVLKVTLQKRRR